MNVKRNLVRDHMKSWEEEQIYTSIQNLNKLSRRGLTKKNNDIHMTFKKIHLIFH